MTSLGKASHPLIRAAGGESSFQRKSEKETKKKHSRRSSLRDINKRYGQTIRYPARRKKTTVADAASPMRDSRIMVWSVVVAIVLALGIGLAILI